MIIEIFVSLLIFILSYKLFLRLKPTNLNKNILFTGYRQTGKTLTINSLINEKYKTVPTLDSYTVNYKDLQIREQVYNEKDLFDKSSKILFFIRNNKDMENLTKKFRDCKNIKFVMYKKSNDKIKNVLYLEEEPNKINIIL
ncbi:putative ADP-ribosylation factor-related (ARF) [Vairimorpha necatrix]|uniref:ADP-ribosylation factor-related (ARF) n=1 Tax=Vairimorpha necatrix TaxID=6039 RepID=A0AAX4JF29_9MICR